MSGQIDVIVAAWNSASTIERAVRSALHDRATGHVVVVDDASTDDTASRAQACDDGTGRLVIVKLAGNAGPAHARNVALERTTAPWVTVLDADDYLEPYRLTKLLRFSRDADLVADDLLQISEAEIGRSAPIPMLALRPGEKWSVTLESFVAGNVSIPGRNRKELGLLKPIMRRSMLERHKLRYPEELRLGEDYALYCAALARGARLIVVPAQGYISVIRPDSISGRHSKQDLIRLRDYDLTLIRENSLSAIEVQLLERHFESIDARIQWLEVIEAIKSRRLGAFVQPFLRSPGVSTFLLYNLWQQIQLRYLGKRIIDEGGGRVGVTSLRRTGQ